MSQVLVLFMPIKIEMICQILISEGNYTCSISMKYVDYVATTVVSISRDKSAFL